MQHAAFYENLSYKTLYRIMRLSLNSWLDHRDSSRGHLAGHLLTDGDAPAGGRRPSICGALLRSREFPAASHPVLR